MGNKLCKRKSDVVDNPKSQTPFVRIINRLHLRPKAWKSETQLNQKQTPKKMNNSDEKDHVINNTQQISKSSDWTEVSLEVPDEEKVISAKNAKLSTIFDNNISTPTPPPRKHKKGIREKLEAVAKNGLQAFQSKKPVDEPLCVKKIVKHTCPLDDHDCAIHNRKHKHTNKNNNLVEKQKEDRLKKLEDDLKDEKAAKRRKNLSVVSLPNYSDLKLTIANFDDKNVEDADGPVEIKKGSIGKSMTRCRSFGSLLPQQLLTKLKVRKVPSEVESDDSFGPLEDWDLRLIEHYNPKDTSLPRPAKIPKKINTTLAGIEDLIVQEEKFENPVAPSRRSESLVKKISQRNTENMGKNNVRIKSVTPPPTPEDKQNLQNTPISNLPNEESGIVEHSSLMRILEEFSMKDKQDQLKNDIKDGNNQSRPVELEKRVKSIEDFLHNEKLNTHAGMSRIENKSKT